MAREETFEGWSIRMSKEEKARIEKSRQDLGYRSQAEVIRTAFELLEGLVEAFVVEPLDTSKMVFFHDGTEEDVVRRTLEFLDKHPELFRAVRERIIAKHRAELLE